MYCTEIKREGEREGKRDRGRDFAQVRRGGRSKRVARSAGRHSCCNTFSSKKKVSLKCNGHHTSREIKRLIQWSMCSM